MDPFTTALRALIGKKVVETAKNAYGEAKKGIESMLSNLNASSKTDNKTTATAEKASADNGANSDATDDYSALVKVAQNNGYTPSDADVDSWLSAIRNKNSISSSETEEDDSDTITYTYKPGDTFGQVLLNLGLSDGSRLWGSGGDVEFYTQQLREQNMLDQNGNVKLGIPFKLRRRK